MTKITSLNIMKKYFVLLVAIFVLIGGFLVFHFNAIAQVADTNDSKNIGAEDVQQEHEKYHARVCPIPGKAGDVYCHARVSTDKSGTPSTTAFPTGYGPVQFHTAYNLPATAAVGTPTIAVVDAFDDPNIEKDLAIYSAQYGLPQCTTANGCFKKVNQVGGTSYPQTNAGWALEIALDVEVAHATCQNCKILLVEANSNSFANLLAAEDYATAHATVVSNSWGGGEFSAETSLSYDGHFNKPGIPITVSSGDSGYGVEYPAASQYVTAVGGTTLTNTNNRWSESAWSGSGSGCSIYEPKPAFQVGVTPNCAGRVVADVSAVADPYTGAAVYDSVRYFGKSGWFQVGGTSLSSPLIAGVYALAGDVAGGVSGNTVPYSSPSNLNDILSGSNGSCGGSYLCTALFGYDGPTGLGTPNGTKAF